MNYQLHATGTLQNLELLATNSQKEKELRTKSSDFSYFLHSFISLFLVFSCWLLTTAPSAQASLYTDIHQRVEQESAQAMIDGDLVAFVVGIINEDVQRRGELWHIDTADLDAAAGSDRSTLCGQKTGVRSDALTQAQCELLHSDILLVLGEELRTRALGRNLVGIVAGFEALMSDTLGRPFALTIDQEAILTIWRAGEKDPQQNNVRLRVQTIDEESVRESLTQLGTVLSALDPEQLVGVVRRYRHGVRFVLDERVPRFPAPIPDGLSGPGTERQYEFKRWPSVESALQNLWDALPDPASYDPPLEENDVILLSIPEELRSQLLPRNVLVWAQVDGDPEHPFGDAGLAWMLPEETLWPSLVRDPEAPTLAQGETFIRGGTYPPEPVDGDLCSHPLALRGYLCRSISDDIVHCPALITDPSAITLTTCTVGAALSTTSGPDVCSDIQWSKNDTLPRCDEPGSVVEYKNRIGTNFCYVGRCAEDIFEREEIAGRTPFTAQDAGSPWFEANEGARVGSVTRGGLIPQAVLPTYRPRALAQEFDASLCASTGLPRQSPPFLCVGAEGRQLALASMDYAVTMQKFLQQQGMQEEWMLGTGDAATALGHEEGQVVLVETLRNRLTALSSVLETSVHLLQRLRDTSFPTEMCPFSTTEQ